MPVKSFYYYARLPLLLPVNQLLYSKETATFFASKTHSTIIVFCIGVISLFESNSHFFLPVNSFLYSRTTATFFASKTNLPLQCFRLHILHQCDFYFSKQQPLFLPVNAFLYSRTGPLSFLPQNIFVTWLRRLVTRQLERPIHMFSSASQHFF